MKSFYDGMEMIIFLGSQGSECNLHPMQKSIVGSKGNGGAKTNGIDCIFIVTFRFFIIEMVGKRRGVQQSNLRYCYS